MYTNAVDVVLTCRPNKEQRNHKNCQGEPIPYPGANNEQKTKRWKLYVLPAMVVTLEVFHFEMSALKVPTPVQLMQSIAYENAAGVYVKCSRC